MAQVEYAMPSGGRQGEIVSKSAGRTKVRMRIPKDARAGDYRLHVESSDQGAAMLPAPFVVSALPEITVRGNAAQRKSDPLPVSLPVIANGVLAEARAADYFSFRVDEPETVVLQVDAMQLGFMLDPV